MIRASAGKARIPIVTRSWPTQPRQRPSSSRIGPEEVPELVLVDLARPLPSGGPARPARRAIAGRWWRRRRPCAGRACRRSGAGRGNPRGVRLNVTPSRSIRSMIRGAQSTISLDRRLVLQEIAAVDGVLEMLPLAVAELPGEVVDAVDAALGAAAMRAAAAAAGSSRPRRTPVRPASWPRPGRPSRRRRSSRADLPPLRSFLER